MAFFTWLLARGVILTHERFSERGFQLCFRCYLCGCKAETTIHLSFFCHCKATLQLWKIFTALGGLLWVMTIGITLDHVSIFDVLDSL